MNNDLISREDLKESLEELKKSPWYCEHRNTIDGIASRQAQKETIQMVETIIDNAPTRFDLEGVERAYNNGYSHAKKEFQRPQGVWTLVSERLPEYSGLYLISVDDLVTVANFTGAYFMNRSGGRVEVNAWQPLPEPYKKGGAV